MGMDTKSRYRNMYQSEASGSNAGAVNSWGRTRRPKELRDPGPIIEKLSIFLAEIKKLFNVSFSNRVSGFKIKAYWL